MLYFHFIALAWQCLLVFYFLLGYFILYEISFFFFFPFNIYSSTVYQMTDFCCHIIKLYDSRIKI
jgi:hypothetical protein